jgi:hypothetical protein
VIVKKTNMLSKDEIHQYCNLFHNVFGKRMTVTEFAKKYQNNVSGYSYHSFMLDDNKIVGSYTVIPHEYKFFDNNMIFGLSVDTMIKEEYRGSPFVFKKLANNAYMELKKDAIPFVFGFPNDNVYLVRKKILKWQDIGDLKYYVMPIRIGKLMERFKKFGIINNVYAHTINLFSPNSMTIKNNLNFPVEKVVSNGFLNYKYDNSYIVRQVKKCHFVYKIYNEDNIVTAFIIDVYPLNKNNIEYCAKNIYQNEKEIDIIVYVGNLDFKAINLIKVPKKYEPKSVHMSGKILIPDAIDKRVFDLKHWNVNLSNYDVR